MVLFRLDTTSQLTLQADCLSLWLDAKKGNCQFLRANVLLYDNNCSVADLTDNAA